MCTTARRRRHSGAHEPGADRRRPSHLRASDADRDETVAELNRHAAQGRLTVEELEERVGTAHNARTLGELRDLLADLPPARVPRPHGRREPELHAYLAVMALLVAIWALTGAGYFWPVWPMLGWGVALLPSLRRAPRRGGRAPA